MGRKGKHILVLGAYGGVGKSLCKVLLDHSACHLSVAGRNLTLAQNYAESLQLLYPNRSIHPVKADAANRSELLAAFRQVDLVIVTASIPEYITLVAEAAIQSKTDLIDILLRGDIPDQLSPYAQLAGESGRCLITQAGFHPGLIAPFIRLGKTNFDSYQEGRVLMAMDGVFEKPASCHELFYELVEGNFKILEKGTWRKASWQDAVEAEFSEYFGEKSCFPLQMREMEGLEMELGLRDMGAYAAGFDNFIDNWVFPIAMLIGRINKKWAINTGAKMMHRHIKKDLHKSPRVEFRLEAKGVKDCNKTSLKIEMSSNNAFELTALAVLACIKQYQVGKIGPGLHLMGQVVDEIQLVEDLQRWGIKIELPKRMDLLYSGQR